MGVKVDSNGKELAFQKYDLSHPGSKIEMFTVAQDTSTLSGGGSGLVWNTVDNTLGLVLSRRGHPDKNNQMHQSSVALVLDARDMSHITRGRQVGSHSFGKTVRLANDGKFLVLEINDGSSRGIQLAEFSKDGRGSMKKRNIIHVKTAHCHWNPCNNQDLPEYTEISTPSIKFYKGMKRSTDNNVSVQNTPMLVSVRSHLTQSPSPPRKVYTELGHGGPVEVCTCRALHHMHSLPP